MSKSAEIIYDAMNALEKLCLRKGVYVKVRAGGAPNLEFPDGTPWTVTLHYQKRRYTLPCYTGRAISNTPSVGAVLSCVLSDLGSLEDYDFGEGWCREFGYNLGSSRAKKLYSKLEKMLPRIQKLFGNDYNEFRQAEKGY